MNHNTTDSQRFANKVVIVTGAASGMGRASAQRFGDEGANVWCADVNAEGATETAGMITAAGGTARDSHFDVTDISQCQALVAEVVEAFGGLDVLCNIAGLGGTTAVSQETEQHWKLTMDVNINGPFFLSQAALPHLLESKGNIVNISSTAGLMGQAYMASYCASKHALIGLTKSMAVEFGRKGLRVNAICPGGTNTAFLQGFDLPENCEVDLLMRASLLPEYAEAEDIANTVCFVASSEATFVNGAILSVDGGVVAG
jgi:meso-butanediol dehydrogenase/(S,S)-butanediol dehydrogenase/diacetyl reductase